MALFFDAQWFDTQLSVRGLTSRDVANALGLNAEQVAEIWKDQRELSANDVRTLAILLGAAPQELAIRAGVSTPVPADPPRDTSAALAELSERLARVERALVELKGLVLDLQPDRR